MPYRGRICSLSVNNSLPEYAHTPRFFDNKFSLFGTEQFLVTVTGVINKFVTDNEKCRYILLNMLCQFTLQPCYADNTVIEYCKEDCEAIFDECSESLNQVIGAVKFLIADKGIDFIHTGLPDCSKHKPQEYFKDKPGLTCIKTGFFSKSTLLLLFNCWVKSFCSGISDTCMQAVANAGKHAPSAKHW